VIALIPIKRVNKKEEIIFCLAGLHVKVLVPFVSEKNVCYFLFALNFMAGSSQLVSSQSFGVGMLNRFY
jgi:hypothetical protein